MTASTPKHTVLRLAIVVCILSISWYAVNAQAIPISSEDDIKTDMSSVPCKNADRQAGVRALFLKAGANEEQITVQKTGKTDNIVVTKLGKSKETVIVGAHYDKTDQGCGAIDNWSGVVVLANLFRTIKSLITEKTFVFAAFDREEEGLIGSDAMADGIPKEEREKVCAMVNFDSFGFGFPQALRNVSDDSLIKLAETVSKEMKIPFGSAGIDIASSDSASFRAKKIPSISLHGLNNRWMAYLHSSADKLSSVNMQSVFTGYRHALVLLSKIENTPCASFRK